MSALERLANRLRDSLSLGERAIPGDDHIDAVIADLERQTKNGPQPANNQDLQLKAIQQFWETQKLESLSAARLVAFGLCVPLRPSGPCIMEDRQRFRAVLDGRTGIDQWSGEPRRFRRCYQGLVRSYFAYDGLVETATPAAKQNWHSLRDYLRDRNRCIDDERVNPDWVSAARNNVDLFTDEPCARYANAVLNGDTAPVDLLCEQLGIGKASWFLRELILAQIRGATKFDHEEFTSCIPRLLLLLADNRVLRDRGLVLVLDRYVQLPQPGLHMALRDAAVEWWGNPWLPSNTARWGGVRPQAREMISEWLKREFIEAFFTKLADDGLGDRRRANFWLRYAKSMSNIQFALGSTAMYSTDKDFVTLRQRMKGLFTELRTTDSANNAFIMTMGNLVAVEFGSGGNALYGYDKRGSLPFDLSRPVGTKKNARNSLKHSNRLIWMLHKDGIHGWNRWEEMFQGTLKAHFEIVASVTPKCGSKRVETVGTSPHSESPGKLTTEKSVGNAATIERTYSDANLGSFTKERNLKIEDMRDRNGNLWVRTGVDNEETSRVLFSWGFRYKRNKGWWR